MTESERKETDAALEHFTEYFVRNYPGPTTIIHDPYWHAPKIFRAACYALEAARAAAPAPVQEDAIGGSSSEIRKASIIGREATQGGEHERPAYNREDAAVVFSAAPIAPSPVAAPPAGYVFTHHDQGIIADLEAMASGKAEGFWPTMLAIGSLRLIRQLAAAPVPPSAWMPIETAPQDGRTILLGYFNSHGKWRTLRGQWMSQDYINENWEDPDVPGAEAGWFETAVEADDVPNCWNTTPTHWMPLPSAPQETER